MTCKHCNGIGAGCQPCQGRGFVVTPSRDVIRNAFKARGMTADAGTCRDYVDEFIAAVSLDRFKVFVEDRLGRDIASTKFH